jgi:hypothetical protein
MMVHLLDGCPALVIPVTGQAPICAWSPWTLQQIQSDRYRPEVQHEQICEWLDTIISLKDCYESVCNRYEDILARAVSMVVNGAVNAQNADPAILGDVDPERAGIVMFRY